MSYSFVARAVTKADLLAQVDKHIADIVEKQGAHVETAAVKTLVHAFVDLVPEPTKAMESIEVRVNGGIGGTWDAKANAYNPISAMNVTVSASVVRSAHP